VGHPYLDILGHPTGRLLLEREPYPLHLHQVVDAAAAHGVVVEVNAHPSRLDIDWTALRHGLARGLLTALDPDAHDVEGIGDMAYGVGVARKAWATRDHVLNARPLEHVLEHLAARRARALARPLP
jgi:DNA polymerase (family 10)